MMALHSTIYTYMLQMITLALEQILLEVLHKQVVVEIVLTLQIVAITDLTNHKIKFIYFNTGGSFAGIAPKTKLMQH